MREPLDDQQAAQGQVEQAIAVRTVPQGVVDPPIEVGAGSSAVAERMVRTRPFRDSRSGGLTASAPSKGMNIVISGCRVQDPGMRVDSVRAVSRPRCRGAG